MRIGECKTHNVHHSHPSNTAPTYGNMYLNALTQMKTGVTLELLNADEFGELWTSAPLCQRCFRRKALA